MNIQKINTIIEKIESIPTLPQVVTELMQIIGNPQSSASDVAKILSRDQALTSKILRLANSAYYGFPRKIGTVQHATAILGFNTVKSVALSIAIFDFFKGGGGDGFNRRNFWIHSLGCAVTAHLIGRYIRYGDPDRGFVAGLLHDVGKVILDKYFHDDFIKIIDTAKYKSISMLDAENEILGIGHTVIGEKTLEIWNLPKALRLAIQYHHMSPLNLSSQTLHRDLIGIVYLSNVLSIQKKIGSGGDDVYPVLDDRIWEFLNIDPAKQDWLSEQIDREMEKAKDFLEMFN